MENKAEFTTPAIFDKFPNYFWSAFAGELVAIFGIDIFQKNKDGLRQLDYMGGTSGWSAALNSVCHRLDIKWFCEWYDALDWMESDEFDGELIDELIKRVGSYEDSRKYGVDGAYYRWLMRDTSTYNKVISKIL